MKIHGDWEEVKVTFETTNAASSDNAVMHTRANHKLRVVIFLLEIIFKFQRSINYDTIPGVPVPLTHFLGTHSGLRKTVVVDIDGTLTPTSEHMDIYGHAFPGAAEYLRERANTHLIVYLTARGVCLAGITREWLHHNRFPSGLIIVTSNSAGPALHHHQEEYKVHALRKLQSQGNLQIVECHGDQDSDIRAYNKVKSEDCVYISQVKAHEQETYWLNLLNRLNNTMMTC